MDLLNLDELVDNKRTVQIGGEVHDIADRTVGQMLQALDIANKINEEDSEQVLRDMIDTARSILPTCPVEKLQALNVKQLIALIEYSMISDEEAVAEEDASAGK